MKQVVRSIEAGQSPGSFHLQALEEQLLRFTDEIHFPDDLTLVKLWRRA